MKVGISETKRKKNMVNVMKAEDSRACFKVPHKALKKYIKFLLDLHNNK